MAKNEEFTGLQKAAILLITLGPERSADIFKHLKEDEIEELTLDYIYFPNAFFIFIQTSIIYSNCCGQTF